MPYKNEKSLLQDELLPPTGARHWPLEVRSPHGSLLATRRVGRCLALHQLRRWLQPALAAARHCPSGHRGGFFAPVARCIVGASGHAKALSSPSAQRLKG